MFPEDVLTEVPALTPGPYLHFGGDEALGTSAEDYSFFVGRVSAMIARLGKIPVAWHEAGAAGSLDPGAVGQYWDFVDPRGGSGHKARALVERGGSLILSPPNAVYLDMKPAVDHPRGLIWADGPTDIRRAHEWEPAAIVDGVPADRILGVEAPLRTETVDSLDAIDEMAFPRLAALAEIAWSRPAVEDPDRTWVSFRERVAAQGPLWASQGIRFHRATEVDWSAPAPDPAPASAQG